MRSCLGIFTGCLFILIAVPIIGLTTVVFTALDSNYYKAAFKEAGVYSAVSETVEETFAQTFANIQDQTGDLIPAELYAFYSQQIQDASSAVFSAEILQKTLEKNVDLSLDYLKSYTSEWLIYLPKRELKAEIVPLLDTLISRSKQTFLQDLPVCSAEQELEFAEGSEISCVPAALRDSPELDQELSRLDAYRDQLVTGLAPILEGDEEISLNNSELFQTSPETIKSVAQARNYVSYMNFGVIAGIGAIFALGMALFFISGETTATRLRHTGLAILIAGTFLLIAGLSTHQLGNLALTGLEINSERLSNSFSPQLGGGEVSTTIQINAEPLAQAGISLAQNLVYSFAQRLGIIGFIVATMGLGAALIGQSRMPKTVQSNVNSGEGNKSNA